MFSWSKSIKYFSEKGYHGQALELPFQSPQDPSVDELVEFLHSAIQSSGDTPPVLIAHSLSSYIAQKYLESYSLAGLILVNPVPMEPQQCVSALLKEWNAVIFKNKNESNENLIRHYYRTPSSSSSSSGGGGGGSTESVVSQQSVPTKFRPFSLKLGSFIATNPEASVKLEPGKLDFPLLRSHGDVFCSQGVFPWP